MICTPLLGELGVSGVSVINDIERWNSLIPESTFSELEALIKEELTRNGMVCFTLGPGQNHWLKNQVYEDRINALAKAKGLSRVEFKNPFHSGSRVFLYYGFSDRPIKYHPLPKEKRPCLANRGIGETNASFPSCCGIRATVPDDIPLDWPSMVAFTVVPVDDTPDYDEYKRKISASGFKPFLVTPKGKGFWYKPHDPYAKPLVEDDD